MTKNQAKIILRDISRYGSIAYTIHTRKRMIERRITPDDIKYVLEWGRITKLQKDRQYNNWKCEIHGKDLDEQKLIMQAAIDDETKCIIITVY
jgi:hypothetical protein